AIKTKDPVLIRGNLATGEATTDLKLIGTGLKPGLQGVVHMEDVEATLPFSRLDVSRGSLTFDPKDSTNPTIDLQGTSVIRDYTVRVYVYGTMLAPEAIFTSEPPLPQEEIISLIATGATRQELSGRGNVLAGRAAMLLVQQLYRKIFKKGEPTQSNEVFNRLDLDVGAVDPRTGRQQVSARFKINDQFVLVGDVGVGGDYRGMLKYLIRFREEPKMRHRVLFWVGTVALAFKLAAQTAVDVARPEEQQKARQAVLKEQEKRAKQASIIEFRGEQAFNEKQLRTALKEEITTIEDFGLSPARGDDLAFFLEVFYRKHGYADVNVHYTIESQNRLRLDITEGPRYTLGKIVFDGNVREPSDKLFEYAVGPTRERYSKAEKRLPFVAADMQEGADLVHRFYLAEGFLDAVVDAPRYTFHRERSEADVIVPIHEGRQYFFGSISFHGRTIYDSETLRGQTLDLLQRPYTDARVEDIPRRLQAYYKTRGYYDVKVVASGAPEDALNGRVPVDITISAGPVYYFDGVTVSGLDRLRPSYVIKRFTKLEGKAYSPEALDERFRTLMRTGLFNVLQIKPVPVDGHLLLLDVSAEEAKSKEFGFLVGYGTFEGAIGGVQW